MANIFENELDNTLCFLSKAERFQQYNHITSPILGNPNKDYMTLTKMLI